MVSGQLKLIKPCFVFGTFICINLVGNRNKFKFRADEMSVFYNTQRSPLAPAPYDSIIFCNTYLILYFGIYILRCSVRLHETSLYRLPLQRGLFFIHATTTDLEKRRAPIVMRIRVSKKKIYIYLIKTYLKRSVRFALSAQTVL